MELLRLRPGLVAAVLLVAVAMACGNDQTGASEGITLFEHPNFEGASVTLAGGFSDFDDLRGPCNATNTNTGNWDDCASSIRVDPGWGGMIFEDPDYRGEGLEILGDTVRKRLGRLHLFDAGFPQITAGGTLSSKAGAEATKTLAEFMTPAITTGGDGTPYGPYYRPMIPINPHIKYYEVDRRGYFLATVTRDELRLDLLFVTSVEDPNETGHKEASWVVEDGEPGAKPA